MRRADAVPVVAEGAISGVMFGVPMYGGLCHDAFLLGMLDARAEFQRRGIPFHVVTLRNESLIQRARNRILAHFLASDASHLFFIDADIGFDAGDVLRLIAHNRQVIGATYAKKSLGTPSFAYVPVEGTAAQSLTGLVEVAALPTGFLCIKRDAIQRLVGAHQALRYQLAPVECRGEPWEQQLYALFDCMIDPRTRTYWSEDYTFCRRWADIGGRCWLDPNIILDHHGTAAFTGDPATQFNVIQRAAEAPPPPVLDELCFHHG